MNILICLIIITVTGIFLMKRYQPQPILIGMGILMMYIAYGDNWISGMFGLSKVTGSNVAPLFTLVPLVPKIVDNLGLDSITTMLAMQNGASLGLFLSPISPVMVGVAGVAHIKAVDLLKRTAVPVLVALIKSCLGIWVLY